MRIFHANFHHSWYGQPVDVFVLSRELVRRGHRVTVAAPPGSALAERAREAGLEVFVEAHFPKTKEIARTLKDVGALGRHLTEAGYDVLHTHGSQDTWSVAATRWWKGIDAPHLMTRHNTKRVRDNVANRWLYRQGLEHLVLGSASARENYRHFLESGVLDEEKVTVLPTTVDVERFAGGEPDREHLRGELDLEEGVPLIGLVGRLDRDKGHRVLLEAAPSILARHPRARFVFVGDGPEEEAVRGEVARLGLEGRVHFLGFRDDIPRVTAGLDVCTLPALGTDSSPKALKEALLLGVPVVAADTGGISELVEEGKTGFVVPRGDPEALAEALNALLDDPERARSMGRRGRETIPERFSPARYAEAHERLYEELIGRR